MRKTPEADLTTPEVNLILAMVGTNQVSPEQLQAIIEEAQRTKNRVEETIATPDPEVSLTEAKEFLHGRLDLTEELDNTIASHRHWGLPDLLVNNSIIEDADKYPDIFNNLTIPKSTLEKCRKLLEHGQEILVIFDAGGVAPKPLQDLLFRGIPCDPNYNDNNPADLRKIDLNWVESVIKFLGKTPQTMLAARQAAYKFGRPIEVSKARILFTLDTNEEFDPIAMYENETGHNSREILQSIIDLPEGLEEHLNDAEELDWRLKKAIEALIHEGKIKFLDPIADWHRYRIQLDKKLRQRRQRRKGRTTFNDITPESYQRLLYTINLPNSRFIRDEQMPNMRNITYHPNYVDILGCTSSLYYYAEDDYGHGIRLRPREDLHRSFGRIEL